MVLFQFNQLTIINCAHYGIITTSILLSIATKFEIATKLPKFWIKSLRLFVIWYLFTGSVLKPVNATLSSTLYDDANRFGAANCIDGSTDSDRRPADNSIELCCTAEPAEAAPWIAIDYNASVTVRRVEIFNGGQLFNGRRTREVDVRISDELPTSGSQMFSGGTLFGHFAGPGTGGQHIIISGQKQLENQNFF